MAKDVTIDMAMSLLLHTTFVMQLIRDLYVSRTKMLHPRESVK